jgi:hypothetical protein
MSPRMTIRGHSCSHRRNVMRWMIPKFISHKSTSSLSISCHRVWLFVAILAHIGAMQCAEWFLSLFPTRAQVHSVFHVTAYDYSWPFLLTSAQAMRWMIPKFISHKSTSSFSISCHHVWIFVAILAHIGAIQSAEWFLSLFPTRAQVHSVFHVTIYEYSWPFLLTSKQCKALNDFPVDLPQPHSVLRVTGQEQHDTVPDAFCFMYEVKERNSRWKWSWLMTQLWENVVNIIFSAIWIWTTLLWTSVTLEERHQATLHKLEKELFI